MKEVLEIFKTKNNLNPSFMKEFFCPINHTHNTRNDNLAYPNPNTVRYGLETFGNKASHTGNALLKEISSTEHI